jgi:anaerobic ribonucleoside-triphosphate reductase activating protein
VTNATLNLNGWWSGPHPLLGRATHVWTQGCPRRCPGCCNTGALDVGQAGVRMTPGELAAMCLAGPRGLVLSGGEPFIQAGLLARACELLRERVPDVPILCYTGYLAEELLDLDGGTALLRQVDVLIDGPFEASLVSESPLVGSANQRILLLTRRVSREQVSAARQPALVAGIGAGGVRMVAAGAQVPHMLRVARALAAAPLGTDDGATAGGARA